jgi:YHS domain-containing protein
MPRRIYPFGLVATALSAIALGLMFATAIPVVAGPTYLASAKSPAASGYDVTSYFAGTGVPVKGNKTFTATANGATYYFASAANAARFKANPVAFTPQYGGHCAWAIASGNLAPGNPLNYKVVGGKLYLNYNKDVQTSWLKDISGFISKADGQWPKIPDTK